MGTRLTIKISDEFLESLFKKQDGSLRCVEGVPQEAKLLEIIPSSPSCHLIVFQLPDKVDFKPLFEARP